MKVYIETYGCQMNEYDTEIVKAILCQPEYEFISTPQDADLILLNTCSVRENANRKVFARIHELRHLKKQSPALVGLLGCMVTDLKESLFDLPLDFIAGPDSYKRLPGLIERAQRGHANLMDAHLSKTETYGDIYPVHTQGVNAWIAVMRGCNNFCSFCIVPYTRGRERSRCVQDVVQESKEIASQGFKQITLLGQNVNSYQKDGQDFADLLQAVSSVDGIGRIRFTSPHPKDFPSSLIDVMAQNPKVCKHIHLPLQAGNDRILKLMRRTYTKTEYLELVDQLKSSIHGLALTTDIIIGFPGETETEFQDTVDVVKRVQFDSAFIFKYSERQGTAAAKKYQDDVSEKDKTERIVYLNALQKEISYQKNLAVIGDIQTILLEHKGTKKSPQEWQGRNDANKIVIVPPGNYQQGDFLNVKIIRAGIHALRGEPI